MRPTNEYYLSTFLEPWSIRPCVFHTHPEDGWELECPMSLCFKSETYPDPLPRVQYFFLAEMTLRGTPICYVQQVAAELHIEEKRAKSAVNNMVEETVVEWVVPGRSFRLAPP